MTESWLAGATSVPWGLLPMKQTPGCSETTTHAFKIMSSDALISNSTSIWGIRPAALRQKQIQLIDPQAREW